MCQSSDDVLLGDGWQYGALAVIQMTKALVKRTACTELEVEPWLTVELTELPASL
ncbi:MAG TPA: hypothetical protein VIK11_14810 [Tepidiformaceae bacterium]